MTPARLKVVVREHLELAFADAVRRVEQGWIDQDFSPLGSRRHIAAVRRRLAAWYDAPAEARPKLDASIIGRRHLLTVDALAEEYFRPVRERTRGLRALRGAAAANCNGRAS